MKKILSIFALLSFSFVLMSITPAFAEPNGPKTGGIWICPSVSTKNPNGMWVIGEHGAYYILKPGTHSPKWPDILNPTYNLEMHAPHVEELAQVHAGYGLYHKLSTYPWFQGWAMVLEDGAEEWELPEGMYNVTLSDQIPLAAAVFW